MQNTPDILEILSKRIDEDPTQCRIDFDLKGNPNHKWLEKHEEGIRASQVVVNEHFASLAAAGVPADPIPSLDDDLGLSPVGEKARTLAPGLLFEKIEELRPKLRIPATATPEQVIQAALDGRWSRNAIMLCPLSGSINPWVHFAHMAMMRRIPWMGYHQETDTIIQRARNACADAFLKSDAEWAFWVDGDTVPPFNDPAFFFDPKRMAAPQKLIPPQALAFNAIERLMRHKKTIVGGVYQQRRRDGRIVAPISEQTEARIRREGPKNELLEVAWAATGCLLVHRSVFEDIQKARPDLAPLDEKGTWNFFGHDIRTEGEDIAFCKLAASVGHPAFLDIGIWCAHVGNFAYFPEAQL